MSATYATPQTLLRSKLKLLDRARREYSPAFAQAQQQSLHKENDSQEQKTRLQAVVYAVRILNTAEYRYYEK